MFLYEALGMFMAALSLSLSPFSFGIFSDRLNVRRSRRCRIKEGSTLPSAYMGLGYMFFFAIRAFFGWPQIGFFIIKLVGYMVFYGLSAYMVSFWMTKP